MKRNRLFRWAVLLSLWTASMCHADTYTIPDTNIVLTYTTSEGRATITACNRDASGVVNIPEKLGEFTVTEIGYRCFVYCGKITELNLPASLMTFGQMYGCPNMTAINVEEGSHYFSSVGGVLYNSSASKLVRAPEGLSGAYSIPESVLEISSEAFYACSKMTSVSIPEGVKTLNSGCFRKCTGLTSVTIPTSVRRIERSPFGSCSSLIAIEVAEGNSDFCDVGGVLYDIAIEELIQAPGGLSGHYVVPDTVTSIGDEALAGCSVLSGISIPSSVSSIGYEAFLDCSSLLSVVIPDGVSSISQALFRNCSSLISVSIPDSVTLIEYGAFEYCSSLESVVVPAGVTEFKGNCFYECSNLKRIYFEGDAPVLSASNHFSNVSDEFAITYMGTANGFDAAVWDSYTVKAYSPAADFTYTDDGTAVTITGYQGSDTDISIPPIINGMPVTVIGASAFQDSRSIVSLVIPKGVTSIGDTAFRDCAAMSSISIPDSVTSIGNAAFYYCSGLSSLTLPDSVTSLDEYCFKGCSGLSTVTLPDSVSSVGNAAFSYCTGLSSVTLPDSLVSLGNNCFEGCSQLSEVVLPDGLTSIPSSLFSGCSNLSQINIPEGVSRIENRAFYGCTMLGALGGVTLPEGLTSIGMQAFYNCSAMESVNIPASLRILGIMPFAGCSALTGFDVAEASGYYCGIDGVLFNKRGTTLICHPGGKSGAYVVPDGVTTLKAYSFYKCTMLNDITLSDDVSTIGQTCFYGCTGLTQVTIPGGISSLEMTCFSNCSNLERLTFEGHAPDLGTTPFASVSEGFVIYYPSNALGYDDAAWADYTLIPYDLEGFAAWMLDKSEQKGKASIRGDLDGDGISNMLEYAFGTTPDQVNCGACFPVGFMQGDAYVFSHRRAKNRGLNFKYLTSDDLKLSLDQWTEASVTPEVVEADVDGDGLVEQVSVSIPMGGARMFVVLAVSEEE